MKQRFFAVILAVLTLSAVLFSGSVTAATSFVDIVCVGESLTCGSGANEAGTITEPKKDSAGNVVLDADGNPVMVNSKINQLYTFPFRLGKQLGYGYTVYNYGISGIAVLPEYKWAWAAGGYLVTAKNSSVANPFSASAPSIDYVVIMLGTNDAKDRIWKSVQGTGGPEDFYNYYAEMIDAFRALETDPQIVCVVPPPVVNGDGLNDYEIKEETLRDEISPIIRRLAREKKCMLLDLREVFPDPVTQKEELLSLYAVDDGVHPNKEGYQLIADSLMKYIRRLAGDNDLNGAVNLEDVSNFALQLAGWEVEEFDAFSADTDVSGEADIADLTRLAMKLAGWDVRLY